MVSNFNALHVNRRADGAVGEDIDVELGVLADLEPYSGPRGSALAPGSTVSRSNCVGTPM